MIHLYKIFIRPLFEYGHTATISATNNAIGIWENNQTQFIKKVLNLRNISKENIRKFGNITTIRTRINDLMPKWYTNRQNGQILLTLQKNYKIYCRTKNLPEPGTREHDGIDNSPKSFLDKNSIS